MAERDQHLQTQCHYPEENMPNKINYILKILKLLVTRKKNKINKVCTAVTFQPLSNTKSIGSVPKHFISIMSTELIPRNTPSEVVLFESSIFHF